MNSPRAAPSRARLPLLRPRTAPLRILRRCCCHYTLPPATKETSKMNVLVAGGAGYIGSHTTKRLKEAGHSPVIYDNLSRGHLTAAQILKVPFIAADLNDRGTLT